MKKESISDFLFDRHFQDQISGESLKGFPKKDTASLLASCIAYILKFKRIDTPPSKDDHAHFSDMKSQSLELFRQHDSLQKTTGRYWKVAVAASILLVVGMSGYWIGKAGFPSDYHSEAGIITFSAPRGQQSELTLPDGTFVALNDDSQLKYHLSQQEGLREVELTGEAFFRVTKNKSRTFRVITPDMSVKVLGTEFNVRAYKNDLYTETVLLEGSIELEDVREQEGTILLKPGEKWSYNKFSRQHSISKVDPRLSTLWRRGEYYFDRVSLGELAKTLERMYKVNIHFVDSSLEDEIYSGSVFRYDGITKVFGLIDLTVPLTMQTKGDSIIIDRR